MSGVKPREATAEGGLGLTPDMPAQAQSIIGWDNLISSNSQSAIQQAKPMPYDRIAPLGRYFSASALMLSKPARYRPLTALAAAFSSAPPAGSNSPFQVTVDPPAAFTTEIVEL